MYLDACIFTYILTRDHAPSSGLRTRCADDFGDFPLEEAEIHPSLAEVVAYGDGIIGITGKLLFFGGNFD
jgi:hypothetical protein